MRRLLSLLLVVPLVALGACSSSGTSTTAGGASVTEIDGTLPELSGATLQGATLDPASLEGRPVVVNFWATWCGPCRREQPGLSAVAADQGAEGAAFVGVNYRDDAAAAKAYVDEFDVAYPSLQDPSGGLAYRFGVPYLPSTIVADAEGRLRYRIVGAVDEQTLRDLIAEVSAEG